MNLKNIQWFWLSNRDCCVKCVLTNDIIILICNIIMDLPIDGIKDLEKGETK